MLSVIAGVVSTRMAATSPTASVAVTASVTLTTSGPTMPSRTATSASGGLWSTRRPVVAAADSFPARSRRRT